MTRQTWTAIVSAGCFVVLALLLALLDTPFVAWGPGRTLDLLSTNDQGKPTLAVAGTRTYPVTGQLRMTTVSVTRVDSHLSLPEALFDHWMPYRDVLERSVVYPPGKSSDEVHSEEVTMMTDAKSDAVVAALRAAHQQVQELPQVESVGVSGPSYNKLQPGDLLVRVDQTPVKVPDDVGTLVQRHQIGDAVVLSVLRKGRQQDVTVTTVPSNTVPKGKKGRVPVIGIVSTQGYLYTPTVSYGIDPSVVGPSAGLVFALAIYDRITPGDLVGGRSIAGTGTIDADGSVGAIGGIQEKIAGAEHAGAKVFLVPAANCPDVRGATTSMRLVKVSTLAEAVSALDRLKGPAAATVPSC